MAYELDPISGVEIIDGVTFTPVKTVGGSARGLTHHGYIDPRDRQYKVCRMDESVSIAAEIVRTQLPAAGHQQVVDIKSTDA